MSELVSESEREYINQGKNANLLLILTSLGVAADIRNDGRKRNDFRYFSFSTGVIPQANSSARLQLGSTDVIIGVRVDLGAPKPAAPNEGFLVVSVESRERAELATTMAQAMQRVLMHAIDLKKLALIPGQQVWQIYIDALVMDADSNILDALVLAARVALSKTTFAKVNVLTGEDGESEIEILDEPDAATPLDISNVPLCITMSKIGYEYVIDPSAEEESCASARVTVVVTEKGDVSVQKGGQGAIDPGLLLEMMQAGKNVGLALHADLSRRLK